MSNDNKKTQRILRLRGVQNLTGLSRSSIYNFMREGTFPRSIPLGRRAIGWREQDILNWIECRARHNDQDCEVQS